MDKRKYLVDLPPRSFDSMKPEDYIRDRINDQLRFYDNKASFYKSRYLFMRAATVIGGAIVPVLVNLSFNPVALNLRLFILNINVVKLSTTLISLMVVLFVSLESVYHFKEQWRNYRSTAELLKKEYFLFGSGKGRYAGKTPDEAFKLFVEQSETAIDVENASTLQVMTTVSDVKRDNAN
ncbi:MAG: hypothetical protein QOF72_32 [Blastocatellia bacterium]|nr:hypothetical protein [Blastocatellia bacterium]